MKYTLRHITHGRFGWFAAGLCAGLASPVQVYAHVDYRPQRSAVSGMRSDWERIGQDFRTVIGREHVEAEQESRRSE